MVNVRKKVKFVSFFLLFHFHNTEIVEPHFFPGPMCLQANAA
jgi:hypothetical protein